MPINDVCHPRGFNRKPEGIMCTSVRNSSSSTRSHSWPLIYVIMGVSGCGKSTVGQLLASELHCAFYDADNYHPQQNISESHLHTMHVQQLAQNTVH
jgi:replication-associated recombination protein RarA